MSCICKNCGLATECWETKEDSDGEYIDTDCSYCSCFDECCEKQTGD